MASLDNYGTSNIQCDRVCRFRYRTTDDHFDIDRQRIVRRDHRREFDTEHHARARQRFADLPDGSIRDSNSAHPSSNATGQNFTNTVFDDEAATEITSASARTADVSPRSNR